MLIVTSQTGRNTDTQRRTVLVVTSQTQTLRERETAVLAVTSQTEIQTHKEELCWL